MYNTQIKAGYTDNATGNLISIDASKRNHDERLNDVMNEFSNKRGGNKQETQSKSQKPTYNRNKNNDSDDDDIVGMMDRLNKK